MIAAPAILTNATSTLASSTLNRMFRTRDRMNELFAKSEAGDLPETEAGFLLEQVNRVERQAELYLRALYAIYVALGAFAGATLVTLLAEGLSPLWGALWFRVMAGFGIALALVGVPMRKVIRLARDARDARYGLLRGYFHGADDDTVEELAQERLASVSLPPVAACIGNKLADLALHATGVTVVSLRLASGAVTAPDEDRRLAAGDTLVLSGLPEPLALAEEKLLRG